MTNFSHLGDGGFYNRILRDGGCFYGDKGFYSRKIAEYGANFDHVGDRGDIWGTEVVFEKSRLDFNVPVRGNIVKNLRFTPVFRNDIFHLGAISEFDFDLCLH